MKSLVFDSGPLISLAVNNLLWLVEPLNKLFDGDFYITESVKTELVDDPLTTKMFKFEAFQMQELITKQLLKVLPDSTTKNDTLQLLKTANSCFIAHGKELTLIHYAEVSALAAFLYLNSEALVMDERITRELIEHPYHLAKILEKRLKAKININKHMLSDLHVKTQKIGIIRSTELATIAFEAGLLNHYLTKSIVDSQRKLLEGILWGLKLHGCAINDRGISVLLSNARQLGSI